MLNVREGLKIYCYLEPIDMRKSIDGLNILISEGKVQPHGLTQTLYVFRNKDGNKVKILFWDRNGYVLYYKRLELRRFRFPKNREGGMDLTPTQLEGLLRGLEFELMEEFDEQKRFHFC